MATEDPESEKVKREFINGLNRHGYAFQQAVAERVAQLGKAHKTTWAVEAIEFPVAVQEAATSIDLVLQAGPTSTYLVGECKRVDPALGRWCFANADERNGVTAPQPDSGAVGVLTVRKTALDSIRRTLVYSRAL